MIIIYLVDFQLQEGSIIRVLYVISYVTKSYIRNMFNLDNNC